MVRCSISGSATSRISDLQRSAATTWLSVKPLVDRSLEGEVGAVT
jgi:hypothetical protein